jgi:prepilin-type N-terminal cleavage/methylation domain-containing protein
MTGKNFSDRCRLLRAGFTLIELLVVVAILVILIALLLPSLGRAKKISRGLVCLTHLRQIGVGFNAYAGENSTILPAPFFQLTGPNRDISWETTLWQYVTSVTLTNTQLSDTKHTYLARSTFVCPEGQLDVTTGDYQSMGYSMNESLPNVPRAAGGVPPALPSVNKQIKSVVNPSRTLLASDGPFPSVGAFSAGNKTGITTMSGQGSVFDAVALPNQQNRHNLCVNLVMVDGSARPWQWPNSTEIPVNLTPPPNATVEANCTPEQQIFWRGF